MIYDSLSYMIHTLMGDRAKIQVGEESLDMCDGISGGAVLRAGYITNLRRVLEEYAKTDVDQEAMLDGSQDLAYSIASTTKYQASQRGNKLQTKLANKAYLALR